ncbi:hypothetical protein QBC40DRAFT_4485 [Triangularia verruculosa]|uniref:Modin n=1 Tax=Triangularia verruculosa TaxID=2587418 RepID=A0AAN6XB49_9PEZI|nr:hypothetical protein QBC40DRAFT_4485 [Triangularia verruculosa]
MAEVDGVGIAAIVLAAGAFVVSVVVLAAYLLPKSTNFDHWDSQMMGKWANYRKTKSYGLLSFSRLRRTVTEAELPVIFLAPRNNARGPVQGQPIWYIDGSRQSCEDTRVTYDPDPGPSRFGDRKIHTVHNERASWVNLLETIQGMERDSMAWEMDLWRSVEGTNVGGITRRSRNFEFPTLAVGVQSTTRTFDETYAIRRPYATTTITHLIELTATLGMYWKRFDQDEDVYRAEGNGMSIHGYRMPEFGIVFSFAKTGITNFRDHRVIPTEEVKELCYGNMPTIYRLRDWDAKTLRNPEVTKRQKDLKTLQLGSRREVAATLSLIGCDINTIEQFSTGNSRQKHFFPVIFELLGMLGRTLHQKDRCHTYLPNPTIYPWEKRAFSLGLLLRAFSGHLDTIVSQNNTGRGSSDLQVLAKTAAKLKKELPPTKDEGFDPKQLNLLNDSVGAADAILAAVPKPLVLDVIQRHIHTVHSALNPEHSEEPIPSLVNLFKASRGEREADFMAAYFNDVRPLVTDHKLPDPCHFSWARLEEGASFDSNGEKARDIEAESGTLAGDYPTPSPRLTREDTEGIDPGRNTVWCTLVFRMICWLLLHNFDQNDVQMPKSELLGSRLPVYII